jgi:hypothetical protein
MRKISLLLIASAFIWLGGCSGGVNAPKDFSDVTTEVVEPDSLFGLYSDSLNKYFGALEQDLIRNYKKSREQLDTQEDFYAFYRNTHTLKVNLKRTLQSHLEEHRKTEGQADGYMPDFTWFSELAKGLEVAAVKDSVSCDIFYDYDILLEYAKGTQGNADDEYTKLIRICFEDNNYYPIWVMPYADDANPDHSCSRLGSGKHYVAMRQLLIAQNSGELFRRELARVKRLLYRDIFLRKEYCYSAALAVKELQNIVRKLDLKTDDQVLFEARIKHMQDPERYGLQFNCQSGECDKEVNERPNI